ncbi:MAG: hypothetical protein JWO36_6057 [Myxococcales bacterium]|nr:hypothetical protein [Myxococcales bacterium]
MRTSLVCGLVIVGFSAVASAQPGAPDGEPPPPSDPPAAGPPAPAPVAVAPPVAPEPPASTADQGVIEDANSPGAFLFPSALSEPAGTFTASLGFGSDTDFKHPELTHIGVSYSPTNEVTLSGSLVAPTVSDLHIGLLSAKIQAARSGRMRVALDGTLVIVSSRSSSDEAGLVGGVVSYCFDDGCNSYASGYLGIGIEHSSSSAVPFLVSGSVVAQLAPHFKLVGEVVTGFQAGGDASGAGSSQFIGFYGARITQKNLGVNLGFIKPFGDNIGVDGLGAFFATATARVLP